MNQIYFVVKMDVDANGNPINGTAQYVSVLTDSKTIEAAEGANKMHRERGRTTSRDIIEDAAKRNKPTLSQFPALRA